MIAVADFADPDLARFLQEHLDDLTPTAPAESRHAFDLSALQQPHVRMWVARDGEQIIGTVALAGIDADHEELKSMRTAPTRRGQGIASRLLAHALDDARRRGVAQVSLETGSMEFFSAARALYARAGFLECAPFGDCTDDPHSVFMTKSLGPNPDDPARLSA
ncbi:GNAT family N-acetyltransferase [Microbacterium keratanolyticum]